LGHTKNMGEHKKEGKDTETKIMRDGIVSRRW